MKKNLWFGVYRKPYQGNEPAFFDSASFSWESKIKDSYPEILEQLSWLISNDNEMTPYFDENLQFPPKNWKTISFCFWGMKIHENLKRFPAAARLLTQIPGLIACSLSLLEPHSVIKPHYGETNGVFRIHMGIKVPASLPDCGFRVNGEARAWQEGELLVFLDAYTHEAFNNSPEKRYILIMDIVRPEFIKNKKYLCVKSLSILTLYWLEAHTRILSKIFGVTAQGKLKKISPWVIDFILLPPLLLAWSIWLPLHNMFGMKKWLKKNN